MKMHSILMLGQSNMVGEGHLDEVEPIDGSRLYVQRCGRWRKWHTPVSVDDAAAGVSPAESFAAAYRDDHPDAARIGLIPCAYGGSSIDRWQPGSILYDNAVNCARLAQRTSSIVAVLWHQGESDCRDGRSRSYGKKVEAVLRSIRQDLGLEDVPLLIGELGEYLKNNARFSEEYPIVNEALRQTAEALPLTGFVSAAGLTANDDMLHINAVSQREFGLRYYAVFRALEDRGRVWEEKPTANDLEPPNWLDFLKENA